MVEQVAQDLNAASQSLQDLRDKYDGALDRIEDKNTELLAGLEALNTQNLNALNEAKTNALNELLGKKTTALNELEVSKSELGTKIEALEQKDLAQDEKLTELEGEILQRTKILNKDLTWSVGEGGDFATLEKALRRASSYQTNGEFKINIILKANYNASFNVTMHSVNLGFVRISAETDLKVNVFNFSFINSTLPKFNNKIKVKLETYNCNIYLDEEITLYHKTNIKCSYFCANKIVNFECLGEDTYTQSIFITSSIFNINTANLSIKDRQDTAKESVFNGVVLWGSVGRIALLNIDSFVTNRVFHAVWMPITNLEIGTLNANMPQVQNTSSIMYVDRSATLSIATNVSITGGNGNVYTFFIKGSRTFLFSPSNSNFGACVKSNLAKGVMDANGGFINI